MGLGKGMLLATGLAVVATSAQAVPSYARQTGAECAACHVGSFGPQLTPYGMKFKMGGYTDTDGQAGKIPLSAMMVVNFTRTAKDAPQEEKIDHFKTNNNTAVQETSVFLAGRLAENIGSFVQSTYSGVDRKWALDQVDLRFAKNLNFNDKETMVGLSLNSNPTLTDPFNTLGQWRFPYTASDFNPGFGPTPLVENLASGVIGLNGYAFYDNNIYTELGFYNNLSKKSLSMINADDPGKIGGVGTYGRVAYFKDNKRDNYSVGLFGFSAKINPDRATGSGYDKYKDLGVDASYQYLGNREHIVSVNASLVREWQTLDYTSAEGGADNRKNHLDQFRIAASYHYQQTWGATAAWFASRGSNDVTLNGENGRPNTNGYILQADWTPWGKESSWGAPWANARLGVQYTGYTKYMGGSTYVDADGNDRRARDNNTTMLFLWTSI